MSQRKIGGKILRTIKILLIAVLIILIVVGLAFWKLWPKKNNSSSVVTASKTDLFGTMLAFDINYAAMNTPGILDVIQQKGWTEFRKDDSAYQNLVSDLKKLIQDRTKPVKEAEFYIDREVIPYFTWNIIEPQKGQFDWELTDIYVKGASNADVKISAVILPYAVWDQKDTQLISCCQLLDFAYYDFKAGQPKDTTEYQNFLTKMVERYKGNVAVWEIGNEPDSPCAGYQDNPQGYLDLLKISYETIKKADPQAIVLNGGALETDMVEGENIKTFWTKFFELNGGKYLDKFNLHYNIEKNGTKPDSSVFLADLTFFNDLMIKNGGIKPIWITEFGTYSGTPSKQNQIGLSVCEPSKTNPKKTPPVGQQVQEQTGPPTQSPEFQAAWYFKNSILAFNNGVERIFPDFAGTDDNPIGASAMFDFSGQSRLFLETLKMIGSKISGFSKVEKIAEGQYKFTVGDKTIYAMWSGIIPSKISGNVKVINIKRQEQIIAATKIKLSADQPVFIEL